MRTRARRYLAGLAAAGLGVLGAPAGAAGEEIEVDLELVIAVDVSRSMDFYEAELQRQGYAQAMEHPQFLRAVTDSGIHGRVAVAYVEWAGTHHQKMVSDWVLIDGLQGARELADRIRAASFEREFRTSISQAIDFAATLFDDNGYQGLRQVIDVSGDGANNQGRPVLEARAAAIARGITINGLPIMTGRSNAFGWLTIENLDLYYAGCVIGGPGAFLVPVRERSQFIEAIRRKLLLEIAGTAPLHGSLVVLAQAEAPAAPVDCMIGERQWRHYIERWGDP